MSKIHDFAREVSSHLNGWSADTKNCSDYYANLDGPNGIGISLFLSDNKVEVRPCFPSYKGVYYPYEHERNSVSTISVSIDRNPASAARDIEKRLIIPFTPVYQKGLERVAECKVYDEGCQATATELANIVGARYTDGQSFTGYMRTPDNAPSGNSIRPQDQECYVEVRIDAPNSIQLKIDSLTKEQAKLILSLCGAK
jgi:hypothetical protein